MSTETSQSISASRHTYLHLRFKRATQFPRFSMAAGEIWETEVAAKTGRKYLAAIQDGSGRFDFAGGQCLVTDVEIAYQGPNYFGNDPDADEIERDVDPQLAVA